MISQSYDPKTERPSLAANCLLDPTQAIGFNLLTTRQLVAWLSKAPNVYLCTWPGVKLFRRGLLKKRCGFLTRLEIYIFFLITGGITCDTGIHFGTGEL